MIMHKPSWALFLVLSVVELGLFSSYAMAQEPPPVSAAEAPGKPWQVLTYRLALAADGKTYQVLMKPTVTPKPDLSLSGQVTIKVPHEPAFQVAQLTSAVKGAEWVELLGAAMPLSAIEPTHPPTTAPMPAPTPPNNPPTVAPEAAPEMSALSIFHHLGTNAASSPTPVPASEFSRSMLHSAWANWLFSKI